MSNYIMFKLKTNEPIKVIHLQKLANQSMLHGALDLRQKLSVILLVRARKLRSFDKAGNVLIEKKLIYGMKDIFPRDFIKYLSYSEVQKDSKVVNVQIRSLRFCSKSVTETLYRNNSLLN